MPPLPTALDFTGSMQTEAGLKTALTNLRGYLSALFGDDGSAGTALLSLGAPFTRVVTLSAATNLGPTDRGEFIEASGTWNLQLPSLATAGTGWSIAVRNTGSGVITLTRVSPDTIDGQVSVALQPRQTVLIVAGVEWETIVLGGTATGQMRLPSGVLATPALALGGQSTGLFSPAADQIGLTVLGVLRVLLSSTALQISIPVTGTAVTQSATDATTGRLLKVGDAGVLGFAPVSGAGATWASVAQSQMISAPAIAAQPTDKPSAASTRPLIGWHMASSATRWAEIVQEVSGSSPWRIWARTSDGGVTQDWDLLFSRRSVLGVVSQAAGVPTGGLIERASNANGEYVRFADGTQICTHSLTGSTGAGTVWTYPAAFIAAPTVTGSSVATVLSSVVLDAAPGATSAAVSARDKADARRADAMLVTAIGRWF